MVTPISLGQRKTLQNPTPAGSSFLKSGFEKQVTSPRLQWGPGELYFLSTLGDSEALPGLGEALPTHYQVVVPVSPKAMLVWHSENMSPVALGAVPALVASAGVYVQPREGSQVWGKNAIGSGEQAGHQSSPPPQVHPALGWDILPPV